MSLTHSPSGMVMVRVTGGSGPFFNRSTTLLIESLSLRPS